MCFILCLVAVAAATAPAADKLSKLWICKECNKRFLCNPNQCSATNRPGNIQWRCVCECVRRACGARLSMTDYKRFWSVNQFYMSSKHLFEDFNTKMQPNGGPLFAWRKSHRCLRDRFSWRPSPVISFVHSLFKQGKKSMTICWHLKKLIEADTNAIKLDVQLRSAD